MILIIWRGSVAPIFLLPSTEYAKREREREREGRKGKEREKEKEKGYCVSISLQGPMGYASVDPMGLQREPGRPPASSISPLSPPPPPPPPPPPSSSSSSSPLPSPSPSSYFLHGVIYIYIYIYSFIYLFIYSSTCGDGDGGGGGGGSRHIKFLLSWLSLLPSCHANQPGRKGQGMGFICSFPLRLI